MVCGGCGLAAAGHQLYRHRWHDRRRIIRRADHEALEVLQKGLSTFYHDGLDSGARVSADLQGTMALWMAKGRR